MKAVLNPERLEQFALAYAPHVLAAVRKAGPWLSKSPEEYAAETVLGMVAALQRGGVAAIEHYYLNQAGALKATITELGLEDSAGLGIWLRG